MTGTMWDTLFVVALALFVAWKVRRALFPLKRCASKRCNGGMIESGKRGRQHAKCGGAGWR